MVTNTGYADVSIVIASHNTAKQPELLKGLIKRFYIIQLILQSNTILFNMIQIRLNLDSGHVLFVTE